MDLKFYLIGFVIFTIILVVLKIKINSAYNMKDHISGVISDDQNLSYNKELDMIEMEELHFEKPMTWDSCNPKTHDGAELTLNMCESKETGDIRTTNLVANNEGPRYECPYCSMNHSLNYKGCLESAIPKKFEIEMVDLSSAKLLKSLILNKNSHNWSPPSGQQLYKFAIKWDLETDFKGLKLLATGLKSLKLYKNNDHQILAAWKSPSINHVNAIINFENPITTDYLVFIFETDDNFSLRKLNIL